jgi:hypothetical protein
MSGLARHAVAAAVAAVALAAAGAVHAATYYVDVDSLGGPCADGNPGTAENAPWCTLGQATASVQAGDTVMLRGGTYAEALWPESSGTESARITFQAFRGRPHDQRCRQAADCNIDGRYRSYLVRRHPQPEAGAIY